MPSLSPQTCKEPPRLSSSFELVVVSDMMMPMILTTMSRGKGLRRWPVAVSIDGFRWELGSDGSLALAKQNDALCALLLELGGDAVQRTTLDMEKVMRDPATRLHWKHKLYDVSWKMDESIVPEGHRSLDRSFQVLVPDSRNENWEFGFVSMLRSNIGLAPVVPNPLFEAFLQSAAAGGAAAAAAGGAAAAADSPLPSAPTKRQRVHTDGSAVATSVASVARSLVAEKLLPLGDDPLMGLGATAHAVAASPHAVASGIDLSLPLISTEFLRSGEAARAGGGGAGGCAALSFGAVHASVGPPSASAAARLASKMKFEEDSDDGGVAAVAAQRACPKSDDEDDLAVAAGARAPSRVGPSLTRASSFDDAKGVSDLLSFAGSVRLHEPLLSPTSTIVHAFGSLNLHSEDGFSDCPLSVIGTLCFHSLPRVREMTEPEGVRSGVRCSFCWRWASQRCLECVSGGTVYSVCDACVERVGLEDVTCLACLPASKKVEGTACVATRIPLKMAV